MPEKILYFDTNSIRELSRKHFKTLAFACNEGRANASVSEWVAYERGRQLWRQQLFDSPTAVGFMIPGQDVNELLKAFREYVKQLYENHNIRVIPQPEDAGPEVDHLIADSDTYFVSNNENDRRDAHILYTAINEYSPDDIIFVCRETKLATEFDKRGFEVCKDSKALVWDLYGEYKGFSLNQPVISAILSNNKPFSVSPDFANELRYADSDYADIFDQRNSSAAFIQFQKNITATDSELTLKVLGYISWFDPITKEELGSRLTNQNYPAELVHHIAERHCIEGIIKKTEHHYLTNKADKNAKEICQQAKILMMDEIMRELGLDQ